MRLRLAIADRSRWLIRGFVWFMFVNGAVIFADGWMRAIGVARRAGASVFAWASRAPRFDGDCISRRPRSSHRGSLATRGSITAGSSWASRRSPWSARCRDARRDSGLITEPLLADLARRPHRLRADQSRRDARRRAVRVRRRQPHRSARLADRVTVIAAALGVVVLAMSRVDGRRGASRLRSRSRAASARRHSRSSASRWSASGFGDG